MYVLTYSTILSEAFITLRRTERDVITNTYKSPCKMAAIFDQILINLNFPEKFSKKNPQQ
jgi:hypothetical protein